MNTQLDNSKRTVEKLSPRARQVLLARGKKGAAAAGGKGPAAGAEKSRKSGASSQEASNLWVDVTHPNPDAKMRLFTFHYAGGAKSIFQNWWQDLPDTVEVCSIQLPGRENRMNETPYRDFFPLAQALSNGLQDYLREKPYAFFGHCMGAMVSYETARQIRRQAKSEGEDKWPVPKQMFISSMMGPQLPADKAKSKVRRLNTGDIDEFFRTLDGTNPVILKNIGLMRMAGPLLRADVDLLSGFTYIKEEPFDFPITCFGGVNDKLVHKDDIRYWKEETSNEFRYTLLPGNHFYLLSHREFLMRVLSDKLNALIKTLPDETDSKL